MFEICQMVLWLIMCLLDDFDPKKINERYNEFLLLNAIFLSIKSVLLFLHAMLRTRKYVSLFFH